MRKGSTGLLEVNINDKVDRRSLDIDVSDAGAFVLSGGDKRVLSWRDRVDWAFDLGAQFGFTREAGYTVLINSGKRGVSNRGFRVVLWKSSVVEVAPETDAELRMNHGQ